MRTVIPLLQPAALVPVSTPEALAALRVWFASRRVHQRTARGVRRYLATHDVRGLHLGMVMPPLPGWLNADINGDGRRCLCIDIRRPLPVDDETIHVIISDHVLDRLTPTEAALHLGECFRVLRPEGRLQLRSVRSDAAVGLLRRAAFVEITTCRPGLSDEPWLQRVDYEAALGADNDLIFEALKPPRYAPTGVAAGSSTRNAVGLPGEG